MKILNIIIVLLLFDCFGLYSQEITDTIPEMEVEILPEKKIVVEMPVSADEQLLQKFINSFAVDSLSMNFSSGDWMIVAAKYFLDTPYVSNTLDVNTEEQLVVNLRELDCMTLIENCLALGMTVQYPNPDYSYFVRQLTYIRYREGLVRGYTSRLHYTSDWITDNMNKGVIEDITYGIGGKKTYFHVNYMSSHPNLYPGLKNNPGNVQIMKEIENNINQRNTYYYIPKKEIREKQNLIKNGDIVCFVTDLPGLDISHLGIAYWNKGQLTFIHASSRHKKVIINPESLADYSNTTKSNKGILVLRPTIVNQDL
ncbi:MAG: DUF1460 domain-containing protein [Bacteroidales bacterium]|nr:DUF1460 domain-containing protein [Bacteroidales bacterium]